GAAVGAAIEAVSQVIKTMDLIGGHNGVNVVGILFTQFVTVTPAFVSPIEMAKRVREGIQQASGLPDAIVGGGLGAGVTWLAAGPALALLGGVAGALGTIGQDSPRPGDVHADRRAAFGWEKFTLVTLNPDRVAVLSWRGYFCAESGGGQAVHANRPAILDWENHKLIRNPDGTVSLQARGGHYFVAENGGGDGSVCNWNRVEIGPWEKFWMEHHPDGFFSLKTLVHGTYVSVQ